MILKFWSCDYDVQMQTMPKNNLYSKKFSTCLSCGKFKSSVTEWIYGSEKGFKKINMTKKWTRAI